MELLRREELLRLQMQSLVHSDRAGGTFAGTLVVGAGPWTQSRFSPRPALLCKFSLMHISCFQNSKSDILIIMFESSLSKRKTTQPTQSPGFLLAFSAPGWGAEWGEGRWEPRPQALPAAAFSATEECDQSRGP